MADPTLPQIFGDNALQDADKLTLSKIDFVDVGLQPTGVNRAESLFVALLLKAKQYLNDTNRSTNTDIQIVINDPSESLTTQNSQKYRVLSYTIELYRPEAATATNPMDY
jgi:hypothetical protein